MAWYASFKVSDVFAMRSMLLITDGIIVRKATICADDFSDKEHHKVKHRSHTISDTIQLGGRKHTIFMVVSECADAGEVIVWKIIRKR